MSTRKAHLEEQLARLAPSRLEIEDFSAAHEGHAGAPQGAQETHLGILIVSEAFKGKTRVERQRMVYQCLEEQFDEGLHALNIKALTQDETQ